MKHAICLLSCVLAAPSLRPQGLEYVKAHYTKYEYEIPMRDGKKLFTAVFAPKDASNPYPILLMRTPYSVSPYGEDNYRSSLGPGEIFAKDGFIFVYQDVRGRWMSEGDFADMRPVKDRKTGPIDTDETTIREDLVQSRVNLEASLGKILGRTAAVQVAEAFVEAVIEYRRIARRAK